MASRWVECGPRGGNPATDVVSWTSDVQGPFGSGLSFTSSALVTGVHVVTAQVTDSYGGTGLATISVTVQDSSAIRKHGRAHFIAS